MNVQSICGLGIRMGLAAGLLAACAAESGDGAGSPLEGRRVLASMQAGDVHFAASHDGDPMPLVAPAVTSGTIIVRTAGQRLLLEELVLDLGDVDVAKSIGSTTQVLHLTDLRLRLGTRADAAASWNDDATAVAGLATADLLLDWGMRTTDGHVIPLATQRVRAAALDLHLMVDGERGAATASVTSTTPGLLWELGDITVSDLSLSLVTAEQEIP
jgi:hypothetical protein